MGLSFGICERKLCYRVYTPEDGKVITSRDVELDKSNTKWPDKNSNSSVDIDIMCDGFDGFHMTNPNDFTHLEPIEE